MPKKHKYGITDTQTKHKKVGMNLFWIDLVTFTHFRDSYRFGDFAHNFEGRVVKTKK